MYLFLMIDSFVIPNLKTPFQIVTPPCARIYLNQIIIEHIGELLVHRDEETNPVLELTNLYAHITCPQHASYVIR